MSNSEKQIDSTKKRRVYQAAKELHVSNEEIIEFLSQHHYKVTNPMAALTDEMYVLLCQHFRKEEVDAQKETSFRKKIEEKKKEEEERKKVIREEIQEILEYAKGSVISEFQEPVQIKSPSVSTPVSPGKTEEVVSQEKESTEETSVLQERKVQPEEKKATPPGKTKIVEPLPKKEKKIEEVEAKPKRHLRRRPIVEEEIEVDRKFMMEEEERERRKSKTRFFAEELTTIDTEYRKQRKKKKKKKKPVPQIDEKEIEASIKETLAKMSDTTRRRKRRREKEGEEEKVEVLETPVIQTTEFITVGELANLLKIEPSEVIKACLSLGLLVTINQRLDRDTIIMVADEFGYDVEFLTAFGEDFLEEKEEEVDPSLLKPRPPVVTIMGHVDHGKTSLLDYIRKSNIIAGEAGGITQHIGAYEVSFRDKKITFLDTPGHEAFTAMRARGAQITDIVVLVVAADDSVMPQTVEAINHARAAGVPIIVAISKIDKPNANPDLIRKQLADHHVLVEQWGGKVQCAEISSKTGQGVEHLLELILLEAELLELKANPQAKAKGVVIEARLDKGRGIVATVLIQNGTLKIGDPFIVGQYYGRVRALFDERDHPQKEAPPSTPVQVLGLTGMPQAGDKFIVMDSEQEAREIALKRQHLRREQSFRQVRRLTLDQISKRIKEGAVKELSVILKADVDGSLQALSDTLMEMKTENVAVRIIHKSVGSITESDVLLAEASEAVILGFHVEPTLKAQELAQKEEVDIRVYQIIYDLVNDVKLALQGMLEPERKEEVIGSLEIRQVFRASRIGMIAGCHVVNGKVTRNAMVRVRRNGEIIYTGKISTLKRFKEDVKEVPSGYDCGLTLENFDDVQVGDILEAVVVTEIARTL